MSYVYLFIFFFTAAHFHLALVAASISHFVTAATKLSCCSSNKKKCLLCFLSLALYLCRPFSLWTSLACRLLSLFLGLSFALYSKINLSLILSITRIQRQLPLSVFVVIDSLVVSSSQDAGSYATSRQNNLDLHLGCHTCRLSYFYIGMPVVRTDGLAVGRCSVTWLPNFLGWVVYHIFLPMVLRCARLARESSTIKRNI